ncbi:MAG TPA: mechanosensitive ion channel domain-containing protein [Streptosporangiaceae bacterium]|nr:mechanosensitive ion channel domain-containing protein [Streptosporangiaceae bacterium]
MDLQERHQLDVARAREQVAKVKARTRPWRYIFALVIALIAAAVSVQARDIADILRESSLRQHAESLLSPLGYSGNIALSYGAAVAFGLLAGIGTIGLGNKARQVLQHSVGSAHAAVVRFAILLVGGLITIVITLQLFNVAVTQLIVGGALTGVLVGIAAQQSLANIFAGIVLLMARPFRIGDPVGIRSGALSGLLEGTVSEISITYVTLETPNGPIHVPNSQVLAAAVGPAGAVPSTVAAATPPAGAGASPADQGPAPTGPAAAPVAAVLAPHPGASGAPADSSAPAHPDAQDAQADQRDAGRPPS